jgi:hypothetical protein
MAIASVVKNARVLMITSRERESSGLSTSHSLLRCDPGERGANKEVGNPEAHHHSYQYAHILEKRHWPTLDRCAPLFARFAKGTRDYDPDSEVRQAGAGMPPAEFELQCRKNPLRCCLLGDAVGLELQCQIRPSVEVTYEQAQED